MTRGPKLFANAAGAKTGPKATVYVVDDDSSIRRLVTWLASQEGWRAAGFASAEAFLEEFRPGEAACLVLDLTLEGMSGLDLQALLKRRMIDVPIVFMSATGDIPQAVEAIKRGAVDFVVKPFDYQKLIRLIRECIAQSAAKIRHRHETAATAAGFATLTPRERQVLQYVIAGNMNRVIAAELSLSIKTVEVHRARIMEKLQVQSLAELVRLSIEHDITGPAIN